MPYKRTYRRRYKKRKVYGKKLNKRQRSQVKRILNRNSELKFHYVNTQDGDMTTSPAIQASYFDVPQGETASTRIGDRLMITGLEMRYSMTCADKSNICRILVVQWLLESQQTDINVSDILRSGPTGIVDVYSLYNHEKRQNYRVLFDKTHSLVGNWDEPTGAPGTTSSVIYKHYRVSLRKAAKQIQYIAGGTTVALNRLYLITMSNSSAGPNPTINISTKMTWRDM